MVCGLLYNFKKIGIIGIAIHSSPERNYYLDMKKWNIVIVAAAVSVLLGGCAMGGATGDKTTQGVQALESGDYTQAQQLFMEALQNGEQEMLA